jgi:hypothetical protein
MNDNGYVIKAAGAKHKDGKWYKLVASARRFTLAKQSCTAYQNAGYQAFIEKVDGGFGVYAEWKPQKREEE